MERHSIYVHIVAVFLLYLNSALGFPDLSLITEPEGGFVPINSTFLLECEAAGQSPITYFWRHDGQLLDPTRLGREGSLWSIIDGNSLRIETVNGDTWGAYQCCAGNEFGSLCSRNASVSIAWIGTPTVFAQDLDVGQGSAFRLFCEVEANPFQPSITWFKDGQPLQLEMPRVVQLPGSGNILHITQARPSDSGNYSCRANDAYLSQTSSEVSLSVSYSQSPPNPASGAILVGPTDTDAVVQGNVTLECLLDKEASVEVTWKRKDGRTLPRRRHSIYGQHNLFLQNLNVNDTGYYLCVARNTITNSLAAAGAFLDILEIPHFKSRMKDVDINESHLARLTCNVTAWPPPTITWYHDGAPVQIQGRISVNAVARTELVIWSSMEDDSGIYQCFAANDAGTVWGAMQFRVLVPENRPPPVTNVTATVIDSTTVEVRWKAEHVSYLAYSVYYYETPNGRWLNLFVSSNSTKKRVMNLQPYTNYTFFVKAFITSGGSLPSSLVYVRTPEAKPTGAPSLWLTSISPFSINISWTPPLPERSNGIITWYKICYLEGEATEYICYEKKADVNNMLLNNLVPDTDYSVRMSAATSEGFGPDSRWVRISTMSKRNCTLSVKLDIRSTVLNSTAVQIDWSPLSIVTGAPLTPEEERNVTGFRLTLTAFSERSQQLRMYTNTIRKAVLSGLRPGAAYNLDMQGDSECGPGPFSAITFELPLLQVNNDPILLPPYNVRAIVLSSTAISLRWNRPTTSFGIAYYSVCAEPTRNAYASRAELYSTSCNKTVVSLEPYTEYELKVKAVGTDITSSYSSSVYTRTLEDVPMAPTDLNLITLSLATPSVLVEWQPPLSKRGVLTKYQVSYQSLNHTQLGADIKTISTNGSTLEVKVVGLRKKYHYEFWVRAFTSKGGGPESRRVTYIAKGGWSQPTQQNTQNERQFTSLGGNLEMGIVVGIVLATLCIMICTLLLVVRHRKDCKHQFCVTKKDEGRANNMELVGEGGTSNNVQIYRPCLQPQSGRHQQQRHTQNYPEDPLSKEPLLNGSGILLPHHSATYLTDISPTPIAAAITTTNDTSTSATSKSVPHSLQGQDSTNLPLRDVLYPCSQPLSCQGTVSPGATDTELHECMVHADPMMSTSACGVEEEEKEQQTALLWASVGRPTADTEAAASGDSSPRPVSYRGTNSDSGMDGDIDWDPDADEDSGSLVIDPATYLSCAAVCHNGNGDRSAINSCHADDIRVNSCVGEHDRTATSRCHCDLADTNISHSKAHYLHNEDITKA